MLDLVGFAHGSAEPDPRLRPAPQADLFSREALKRGLAQVRSAQEVLGRYNDLVVAEQAFRAQLDRDPRAWFAIGWLTAQRTQQLPRAAKALAKVAKAAKALPGRRSPRECASA